MTLDEIRELIKAVLDSGVAELEVQRGEDRVRIRRTPRTVVQEVMVPGPYAGAPAPSHFGHPGPAPAAPAPAPAGAADPMEDPSLVLVKSPIVGTFYEAPSPGAPCFVKAGDTVAPGKVLCIIESMKLMNEIECELAGVIVKQLVDNAQPVEYGQALFAVRPA